jgi:hypothetical protein
VRLKYDNHGNAGDAPFQLDLARLRRVVWLTRSAPSCCLANLPASVIPWVGTMTADAYPGSHDCRVVARPKRLPRACVMCGCHARLSGAEADAPFVVCVWCARFAIAQATHNPDGTEEVRILMRNILCKFDQAFH